MCGRGRLCLAYRGYVDEFATVAAFGEHNDAVDEGIDCVVFAETYVKAGVVLSATLALDYVACLAVLATEGKKPKRRPSAKFSLPLYPKLASMR